MQLCELGGAGNDPLADELEGTDGGDMGDGTVIVRNPEGGQTLHALEQLLDERALGAGIERTDDGLLDLVVVPTDVVAVAPENVELVLEVRAQEQIAGLGVLRHQPQRFLLSRPADHDRWVRAAQCLRRAGD